MEGVQSLLLVDVVEVTPLSATLTIGTSLQLSALPKTQSGIALPGRPVTWSSSDPAIVTVSESGLVGAVKPGGPVEIHAVADGVTGAAAITVTPLPITQVTVKPTQAGIVIGESTQLTATAYDASGAIVSGQAFIWSSSSPATADVTTSGIVLGIAEGGPVMITAAVSSVAGSARITVAKDASSRVGFVQQPSSTIVGRTIAPAVRVAIQDSLGRTITSSTATVTLILGNNPAGATLGGTLAVSAEGGVATFSNLSLDRAGTGYTLTASSQGLSSATSTSFDVDLPPLTIATQPSPNAQSGVPLSEQPSIRVLNGAGNPVSGAAVTVSIASGGGSLSGNTTVTSNATGTASYGNLAISGSVGSRTLRFDAAGFEGVVSSSITLSAGNPSQLTYNRQPSVSASSGQPFAQQPILLVRDAAGNPVSGQVVTATITGTPAGVSLIGDPSATTDGSGVATFAANGLGLSGTTGSYTLTFVAGGVSSAPSTAIAVSAGAAAQLSYSQQPSSAATSGQPFSRQPILVLRDGAGNPVSGQAVTATITGSPAGAALIGTTTVTTNGSGIATFVGSGLGLSAPSGNYTLIFRAGAVSSPASNSIALSAGTPTQVTYNQQPSGSAKSGQAFAQQPILLLRDASNNPVAGQVVTATITGSPSGAALIGTTTATTNSSGVASFAGSGLGISGPVGNYTLTFRSGAVSSAASSTIALAAGTPTQLVYTRQPSSAAVSGQAFAQQPILVLRDAAGNPVSGQAVTATVTGTPSGVTLIGTTTRTTTATGTADFTGSGLGLSGPNGTYTLIFRAGTVNSAASAPISLSTLGPAQVSYTQQPSSSAQSGQAFSQQPILLVRDAANNPVSGQVVTATITGSPAGASLIGTKTATTNASGVASFVGTGLGISGPIGNYTLTFQAGPASSAPSNTIALSAGAPAQVMYTQQPSSSVQSGQAFSQQPILVVRDAANNPISGQVVTATITGSPASASLIGTKTATTNGSGIATFVGSGLGLAGTVGNYTLTFTVGGVSSAASNPIALAAGPATRLTITVQPSSTAIRDVPFLQQPVIQLRDAWGNPVSQAGVEVTASIESGNDEAALKGTKKVLTSSSGTAAYSNLKIDESGTYTLRFSSGSLQSVVSTSITIP